MGEIEVVGGHDQVPTDPTDGTYFECSRCGEAQVYVELDDGLPGEWVSTTPRRPAADKTAAQPGDGGDAAAGEG